MLTTNSGFNLYIGNNPAATGSFASIADTPIGPQWHQMREQLGEARSTDALGKMAINYALAKPVRTAELATTKLARFWVPNPQVVPLGLTIVGFWAFCDIGGRRAVYLNATLVSTGMGPRAYDLPLDFEIGQTDIQSGRRRDR